MSKKPKRELSPAAKEAFRKNEVEANRQMCFACAFMAVALSVAFLFYVTRVFALTNYTPIFIAFPTMIVVLLLPILSVKRKYVTYPSFKYFIFAVLLFACVVVNVLVPKHGVLGYALVLILLNHYYSPKMGRIAFPIILVFMALALFAGMFLGEYDPNLLTEGKIVLDEATGEYVIYQPESPQERYQFLQELMAKGTNRYAAVFGYYYFGRALILGLVFVASNSLNVRTQSLVQNEVKSLENKARIETELGVAEEIQRNVLPNPTYQDKKIEILAQLLPAREVGGDFYDYWRIDDNHIAILIGDVSGKGVPAAMFMMKALTSFRASYSATSTPKEIMTKVNHLLYEGNSTEMFATCFLGILDIESGQLSFANAGHCPPLLCRNGRYIPLPCAHGFLLGSMDETSLENESFKLRKGDALLLYTDGVTEATNKEGALYGEARLVRFLNSLKANTAVELGHGLEDSILEFADGALQSDDITYLNLIYQGETVFTRERSFLATQEESREVAAYIELMANEAKVSPKIREAFLLATDEIFSNIVKYGDLPQGSEVFIRCSYYLDRNCVSLTIIDHGVPFDPTKVDETTVDQRPADAPVGRLGWFMVHKLMDDITYHRINGKNLVQIFKKLG